MGDLPKRANCLTADVYRVMFEGPWSGSSCPLMGLFGVLFGAVGSAVFFSSGQLLVVQTLSLAADAAPRQVELGRGFVCFLTLLSMRMCVRIFEPSSSSLISLDAVLHAYQRRGFLALACLPLLMFAHDVVLKNLRAPSLYFEIF